MMLLYAFILGSRDGAVVRALASHQRGPGSNPGSDAICGLSLLSVLIFAPEFFSRYSGFPPPKATFPNPIRFGNSRSKIATLWILLNFLFIYLYFWRDSSLCQYFEECNINNG